MSQGTILHICLLDKFIPPFIDFVEESFEFKQHKFLLIGDINKFPVRLGRNVIQLKRKSQFFMLLREVNEARKIILHSFYPSPIVLVLAAQPWLLKKCYWVMWGGDLYHHQLRLRGIWSNIQEAIRAFVIKRIGHFVTYIKGDYELAQKWYGVKGEYHKCLMYPSNLYKEYAVPPKQGESINILVGNSADPTNNHAEVFEKLSLYKDDSIQIYCPLSYGQADYADRIVKLGTELFGSKFTPLLDFMPFEKYLELLGQIDIAVFAHRRQQAMGNTITLLGLGKKVFLQSNITSWQAFQGWGVKVFDFQYLDLRNLDLNCRMYNQQIIATHFSQATLDQQWRDIFKG